MNIIEIFRFRYAQLQEQRPSVVASGFWFAFLSFLSRIAFFIFLAGLIITFILSLQIIPDGKMSDTAKSILNSHELHIILACFCLFGMISSGFAARMAQRIVSRNLYILQLESLLKETVLKPDAFPQTPPPSQQNIPKS